MKGCVCVCVCIFTAPGCECTRAGVELSNYGLRTFLTDKKMPALGISFTRPGQGLREGS